MDDYQDSSKPARSGASQRISHRGVGAKTFHITSTNHTDHLKKAGGIMDIENRTRGTHRSTITGAILVY